MVHDRILLREPLEGLVDGQELVVRVRCREVGFIQVEAFIAFP